jgi:hypothetical protein
MFIYTDLQVSLSNHPAQRPSHDTHTFSILFNNQDSRLGGKMFKLKDGRCASRRRFELRM